MKLSQAIGAAQSRKPCAFTDEEMTWWINQLEARVWTEVWGLPELFRKPYNYAEDANAELFVQSPHDDIYEAFLEYRIDWYNGEYQNAANTSAAFNAAWNAYSAEVGNRFDPHGVPKWRQWTDMLTVQEGYGETDYEIEVSAVPSLLLELEVEIAHPFSSTDGDELIITVGGEETHIDLQVQVETHLIVMRECGPHETVHVEIVHDGETGHDGCAVIRKRVLTDKRRFMGKW